MSRVPSGSEVICQDWKFPSTLPVTPPTLFIREIHLNQMAKKIAVLERVSLQRADKSASYGCCSVQLLNCVQLFATPWTAARQATMSITNSQSLLKLIPIESVMPSNHLILCHPLLLLPPIPPSIRVFSNESTLRMRWPKY